MDEKVYQFCGYDYGTFTTREGQTRNYCNIYVLSPLSGGEGRYCAGYRAEKFSCRGPEVFNDIEIQDHVILSFNSYGRVSRVELADQKK